MKTITILLTAVMALMFSFSVTSCSSLGQVGGVVTSAQSWLTDPKNQALIQEIAQAASILIGMVGENRGVSSTATVVGKLAVRYPNVPAGALAQIVGNPKAYLKR